MINFIIQSLQCYKSKVVLSSEEEVVGLPCILLTNNCFTYKESVVIFCFLPCKRSHLVTICRQTSFIISLFFALPLSFSDVFASVPLLLTFVSSWVSQRFEIYKAMIFVCVSLFSIPFFERVDQFEANSARR